MKNPFVIAVVLAILIFAIKYAQGYFYILSQGKATSFPPNYAALPAAQYAVGTFVVALIFAWLIFKFK